MRKIEGMVQEISEDMEFLKRREEKFTRTNSEYQTQFISKKNICVLKLSQPPQMHEFRILLGLQSSP